MIWKRGKSQAEPTTETVERAVGDPRSVFGVGAQVIVRLDRHAYPDSMIEDPIAVIVSSGEGHGAGLFAPATTRDPIWEVRFETPFFALDGSGPFDTARVRESSLAHAPEALAL
ncbi:hypothetical protein [Leifsonia sp. A12D58]|uniref:hypothetical protein n=1 Tax=Leifsonia sp. A12D58 TaxID=3397674 RepID=UPI0039E0FF09